MVFGENQHLTKPGEVTWLKLKHLQFSSSDDYMYLEMKIILKQ